MSSAVHQFDRPFSPMLSRGVLSVAVVGGAAVLGLITVSEPLLAAGAAAVCLLGLAAISIPKVATFAAIFLLYSNVAVVAVRFHGVPKIVGQGMVLLLVIPLVHYVVLRRQKLVIHPLMPLMALYLSAQALSMMFSRNLEESLASITEYVLEGMLIVLLVTNVIRTRRDVRWATWALLLAGLVMTAGPIYQQITHSFASSLGGFGQTNDIGFLTGDVTAQGAVRQHRLSGTIGEQNRFAQITLVLVPLGLLMARTAQSRWASLLAMFLAGVAAVGCALTFSRGAAVAFVLTIGVMIVLRLITIKQLAIVTVAAVILLAAMPHYLNRLVTIQQVTNLIGARPSTVQATDGAIAGRATEMLAAAQIFVDHPVVGVGPGMFKQYSRQYGNRLGIRRLEENRESHSLYLGIAAETGSLGIACFLLMLGVTLVSLVRARKLFRAGSSRELDTMAAAYFCAVVVLMATGLSMHMAYIRFFYLILGMAAAVASVAALARPPAEPAR